MGELYPDYPVYKVHKLTTVKQRHMNQEVWELLQQCMPYLRYLAGSLASGFASCLETEASDLLQQSIYRMLCAPNQPMATKADVLGWACRILRNRAADYAKADARRRAALTTYLADTKARQLDDQTQELLDAVLPAIPGLPEVQREAIGMRLQGVSYLQIAEYQKVLLNTVKSRLHTAHARLRKEANLD